MLALAMVDPRTELLGTSGVGKQSKTRASHQEMKGTRSTGPVPLRVKNNAAVAGGVLLIVILCSASQISGREDSTDLVVFFRRAISSPVDVESFRATEKALRELQVPPDLTRSAIRPRDQGIVYYEGGRSGTNYFLRSFTGTNSGTIIGRSGPEDYQVNANTLTHSFGGADPVAGGGRVVFNFLNQFLNMGLADLKQGTVVWDGNEFTATRDDGSLIYGRLEVSNGLPSTLQISSAKESPPFKATAYTYPDKLTSLGGFPKTITISTRNASGLSPVLELALIELQLAVGQLSEETFAPARFMSTNVVYTNIYTNGQLFSTVGGKLLKVLPVAPPVASASRPARRVLVMICLAGLSLVPILTMLARLRGKHSQFTNER